jgi:hypothetical protein
MAVGTTPANDGGRGGGQCQWARHGRPSPARARTGLVGPSVDAARLALRGRGSPTPSASEDEARQPQQRQLEHWGWLGF